MNETHETPSCHRPGIFYHIAGLRWRAGEPLLCWNRLWNDGLVTAANWEHPKRPVGHDGAVVGLHADLDGARSWGRQGEAIVRVRVPDDELHHIMFDSEEFYCYPDAIPWEWCEVVEVIGPGPGTASSGLQQSAAPWPAEPMAPDAPSTERPEPPVHGR